jgi:hypothetical protein
MLAAASIGAFLTAAFLPETQVYSAKNFLTGRLVLYPSSILFVSADMS